MNVTEFARMGGLARARALTKERRREIARKAALARHHGKNKPEYKKHEPKKL